MASLPSHLLAAGALATWLGRGLPRLALGLGLAGSLVPDLDALGYARGVPYESLWGHRGLTHSLVFALGWATLTAAVGTARAPRLAPQAFVWGFLATASHGVLDAFTNGGLGVAFFAPWDLSRYFFPVRPIAVSPISVRRFLTARGLAVLTSEALWIWLPAALVAVAGFAVHRRRRSAH